MKTAITSGKSLSMPRAMRLAPTEDTKDDGVTEEAAAKAPETDEDRSTSSYDAQDIGAHASGTSSLQIS